MLNIWLQKMIKYLVKYIKSVKNYVKSKSNNEYRFRISKHNYCLEYYNTDSYSYKEFFRLYNPTCYNKIIKIYYHNDITNKRYYLYLPISFNLLTKHLK